MDYLNVKMAMLHIMHQQNGENIVYEYNIQLAN